MDNQSSVGSHPKSAVITGASSGIGEATARLLAQNGYQVVLAARRMDRLQVLASDIQSKGGEAFPVEMDITHLEEIRRTAEVALQQYGKIDLLFNNAGFGRMDWLENLDPQEDIQNQLQANLIGTIEMTQAALPNMIQRRSGHIINMSSIAGLVATPTYSIYAASKFGVRGFSDALRREVSIYGIHVSVIYPGGVNTEFASHAHIRRRSGVTTPAMLRLTAEDVARVVLRLARRPRRSAVIPWPMQVSAWVASLFPRLADWVVERGFVRRERYG